MHLLWVVLIGLVVGALAILIMPGKRSWRVHSNDTAWHCRITFRNVARSTGRIVLRRAVSCQWSEPSYSSPYIAVRRRSA